MINPQDLRIGNYVLCKDGLPIKIRAIERKSILYLYKGKFWYNLEYKYLKPIPLTEEILIKKCGFEKYNHTNYESGYIIEHKEPSKCVYIRTLLNPTSSVFFAVFNRSECNKNEIQFIKKIEYIHDLQNIYKLLTNEELTIQL